MANNKSQSEVDKTGSKGTPEGAAEVEGHKDLSNQTKENRAKWKGQPATKLSFSYSQNLDTNFSMEEQPNDVKSNTATPDSEGKWQIKKSKHKAGNELDKKKAITTGRSTGKNRIPNAL
eukprot:9686948-Ditylum_brightwellii.AAC.1